MKHTVRSLHAHAGVSIVGNVAYLSNETLKPQALGKLARWLPHETWFKKAIEKIGLTPLNGPRSGWINLEALHLVMERSGYCYIPDAKPFHLLDKSLEPSWMDKLPPFARRYLRCSYAMTEGIDPLAIVPKFPYMGFGYIVPDGGMAAEAAQVFHLHRLSGIKQLSFLHDPVLKENDRSAGALMFEHTRYCHVLDTHAVANVIAENVGIKDGHLNTLLTAAISHDALTPAGGDSVKLVDPAAFDEDAHYPELLVGEKWGKYRERFNIDRELLVKTIMGEGLLGHILDIADKSSYLARDVNAYLMTPNPKIDARYPNLSAVADIVIKDPYVCAVWESARKYNGSLVFGNAERLARFLKLRALMFRGLYYNPYSRFFEYLVGKGVVKYMYQNGLVSRHDLLREQDYWIEGKIDETLGTYSMMHRFHNLDNARIEEYLDVNAAAGRAAEFENDHSVIVILDNFTPATNNGTRKFLVRKGNKAVEFADACPKDAEEIEGIMTFQKMVHLYFFSADDLQISLAGRKKLKEIMRSVS